MPSLFDLLQNYQEAPAFRPAPSREELDEMYRQQQLASLAQSIPVQDDGAPTFGSILRGAMSSAPVSPAAQESALAEPNPDDQDVGVRASRLRRGLLGGSFRVGHTGGNILGLLGDAFLAQAGRPAQYAPRLQQRREAEALQGFTQDPMGGAEALGQVNTEAGRDMYGDVVTAQTRQQAQALREAHELEARRTRAHQIAASLAASADESTWPRVRQAILSTFRSRNVEPDVEIPESWDAAQRTVLESFGITPDQRADNTEARRYHDANVGTAQQRVQVSRQSAGSSAAARQGTLTESRRSHDEQARHNREMERISALRAANGRGGNRRASPGGLPTEGQVRNGMVYRGGRWVRQ